MSLVPGGLVLLGAAMTAVFTWYRCPMDQLTGHLQAAAAFDVEGLALTAYLLCAFAFAILAGMLIRRSIGAMAAAFAVWAAIRGFVGCGWVPASSTRSHCRSVRRTTSDSAPMSCRR